MNRNASDTRRQTLQPKTPCPAWCKRHEDADVDHPTDAFRTHYSAEKRAAGRTVQLWRTEMFSDPKPGRVSILLNDDDLSVAEARRLAEALTAAADAIGHQS